MNDRTKAVLIAAGIGFAALLLPAIAAAPFKPDFSTETAGSEPKSLVPVVGIWRVETDAGKTMLAVDGRQWKEGQSSGGIADKARALYGERYAEFLDRVQAFAYYPWSRRTSTTSPMARSAYAFRASRAGSIKAPAFCSTSSPTAIT